MREPTFGDYLQGIGRFGGAFVREPSGLRMYIRRSIQVPGGYEIANVNLPEKKQKKGIFSRFLAEYTHLPLRIENVHNTFLEKWLLRQNDWKAENPDWIGLSASYINSAFMRAVE
jgi:hypothetical protein